jgi:hypothetical protein
MGNKILAKLRRYARERPRAAFLSALLALVVFGLLASSIIRTDQERVNDIVNLAESALEAGDVEALMKCVAADFSQEGMDKQGLRRYVRRALDTYSAPTILIHTRTFDIDGPSAQCTFKVFTRFRNVFGTQDMLTRSQWEVTMRRTDGRWAVTAVRPVEVQGQQVDGLRSLAWRTMGEPPNGF